MSLRALLLCLFLGISLPSLAQDLLQHYSSYPFSLPDDVGQLLVADADGDSLADLLAVGEDRIVVYFQNSDGFDFNDHSHVVEFPHDAVGWDLSDGYGQDGLSLIALLDGHTVQIWNFEGRQVSAPEILLQGLQGFLAKGINRLHLSQDVNGDGLDDLIIPAAGSLNLSIRQPDNSYMAPLHVLSEVILRTNLQSQQLERETGQAVEIPQLDLRDLNGDGRPDLVTRTDTRLDVFLAGQGPSYFETLPGFSLDLAAIQEQLGEFDVDQLDFSNLTGVLALTHEELLDDVDNDGITDLLLREGGKVSLFLGAVTRLNLDQPDQVLRSGGNVLSTFLYDENQDGLKDLWLWRVEAVSVGDLFLWLAISGNIAVEAFVYPNEGRTFARRPSRQLTVTLRFPSALRMMTSVMEIAREARESETAPWIPTRSAKIDDNPEREDLLVMMANRIDVFLDTIEPAAPVEESEQFFSSFNYSRDRNDYEIDIGEIISNVSVNGNLELERVRGRTADYRIELDQEVSSGDFVPVTLNGDQRDDMLVFFRRLDGVLEGMLLLSRPR